MLSIGGYMAEDVLKWLAEAEKMNATEPHLANYMLRDLEITKDADLSDLSWSMYKEGYVHKNDVAFLIEKIRDYYNKKR